MRRACVLEHGRLFVDQSGVEPEPGGPLDSLPPLLFERLARFDEQRRKAGEEPLFDWSYLGHARAKSTVGVVSLPGFQVEILPKTARMSRTGDDDRADRTTLGDLRANLVHMLRYAGIINAGILDVARLSARTAPVSETLIRIFGDRLLFELQRGVPADYVSQRANRRSVRGRILHTEQLRRNLVRPDRVFCRFDSFESDHRVLRLLKATCNHLLRANLTPQTEERLRNCVIVLEEVGDVPLTQTLADGISVDRRFERFADTLDFCRLVARGMSTDPSAGTWRSFSLLFEMNSLFEAFVPGFIRREVLREELVGAELAGLDVLTQGKGNHYLLKTGSGERRLKLKPDIVLEGKIAGRTSTLVIDTKWKVPFRDGRGHISRDDLYQVYAYAREFDADTTVLLYPEVANMALEDMKLNALAGQMATDQQIWTRALPMDVRLDREEGRARIAKALGEIIKSGFARSTNVEPTTHRIAG